MASSSQESAAAPPRPLPHRGGGPQKKRGRLLKRVHRRRRPQGPPGRLDYLGGGLAAATATATGDDGDDDGDGRGRCENDDDRGNDRDDGDDGVHRDSRDSSRLLTPRADRLPAAGALPSDAAPAIDLTGDDSDDDEFAFKDSPPTPPAKNRGRNDGRAKSAEAKNAISEGCAIDGIENDERRSADERSGWGCRHCTLTNSEASSACDACGARRGSTRGRRNGGGAARGDGSGGGKERTEGRTLGGEKRIEHSGESPTDKTEEKGKRKKKRREQHRGESDKKSSGNTLWKWASTTGSHSLSQQSSSSRSSNKKLKVKASSSATVSTKQSTFAAKNLAKKKAPTTKSTKVTNTEMWIDKHAPKSSDELCVAPKKVEEVRSFLSAHVSHGRSRRKRRRPDEDDVAKNPWDAPSDAGPEARLMVLAGSPGVGKSAAVRTLAREMKVEVLSWNDSQIEYNFHRHRGGGGGGSSPFDDPGSRLPYQSQLGSFEEFLTRGGAGAEALDLLVGAESDGSSGDGRDEEREGSLILIEDIPNLYNAEAAESFRNIMERHVQRTQTPTFFIFSDVHDGKHRPDDLERLIPPNVLYSPSVQILPIQPVTKAKMKKCLQSIAKAEGLPASGGKRKSSSSLPLEYFDEIHLASGGDLRHAIFAMQFRCARRAASGIGGASEPDGRGSGKDAKPSMFRALGKLLYAKRRPGPQRFDSRLAGTRWDDGRGPLDFVPEDVLGAIDMGVGPALSFLSCHCPDFHEDAADLSRTLGLLSDAATFADRFGQDDGPFPGGYAACVGGRAVAEGNGHPAPPRFRHLTTPQVFGVMRKSRENESKIERLRNRLSVGGGGRTSVHDNIGSAHGFVTDSLPYMRAVIPEDVNYALANLHSYAKESNGHAPDETRHAPEEENDVLLEDDLVEDDDW